MASLLAVDVGVRTGLASFGDDGRLRWYRSQNFGNAARLRRALPGLLAEPRDLTRIVLEGGGVLADAWEHEGERHGLDVVRVAAETWRPVFMLSREQRSGVQAKEVAGRLARIVIAWSGAKRPTSLRHDAAEAILIGLWGVLQAGWLDALPPELVR
ncbi:MAG TPA: hypothetical protein VHB25_17380 [Gemmatimonadaceae bacterium]|nr:hypothetical protein [Gemmatimonadaceae bacterium]